MNLRPTTSIRINANGCGCEIDPFIPYWIAFGKILCDKCGAPMLHKKDMGTYVVQGIEHKQTCGDFIKYTPDGKLKRIIRGEFNTR